MEKKRELTPIEKANLDIYMKTMGQNLLRIREKQGLSQDEVADIAGINPKSVGGVERGERFAGKDNIAKLSVALGCSIFDLVKSPEIERKLSISEEMQIRFWETTEKFLIDNPTPDEEKTRRRILKEYFKFLSDEM